MNDMSRAQSASRLSEDIGDVLSAIRRLISEDEALDYARNRLQQQRPPADAGEDLAQRFGGHAAMARQMVKDGAAALDRKPRFTELPVPDMRADPTTVAPIRHLSPQREAAPVPDAETLAPLRLGDPDRVDSRIGAGRFPEAADDIEFCDAAGEAASTVAPVPPTETCPPRVAPRAEEFAEPFDAKARMRPEPPLPASCRSQVNPAIAEAPAPTLAAAPVQGPGDWQDGDFWSAYLFAGHQDQVEEEIDPDAAELGDPNRSAEIDQQVSGALRAMTLPVYPAEVAFADAFATVSAEGSSTSVPRAASVQVVPETFSAAVLEDDSIGDSVHAIIDEISPEPEIGDEPETGDETAIRTLVREIIQEELHGELGQRFSRNLRAVIRREVAAAIDEHLERI